MKFVNLLKEACRLILSPTLQSVQTAAMLLLPFHLSSDFMYSKCSTCSPYDHYQEERRWILFIQKIKNLVFFLSLFRGGYCGRETTAIDKIALLMLQMSEFGQACGKRARSCKRLRRTGVDSTNLCSMAGQYVKQGCRTCPPDWESISGLLKRFTNSGSGR
jgi:hypothetical protein